MTNRKFEAWCEKATEKIRYGPDRREVAAELRAHIEDHYDALIARGVAPEDAAAKVLESMGSAEVIAPQLGKLHRPWLGYVYNVVRFFAVVTGCVAACLLAAHLWSNITMGVNVKNFDSLPVNVENITYYCKPEVSATADGYTFRIDEAAISQVPGSSWFYFQLQIRYWPWMEPCYAADYFWAVDSLGNHYNSHAMMFDRDIGYVLFDGETATSGIRTITMALTQFDPNAQWVEICYDRDGRNIVLHIDLTGGDALE